MSKRWSTVLGGVVAMTTAVSLAACGTPGASSPGAPAATEGGASATAGGAPCKVGLVYSKTGALDALRSDVGIVYSTGGRIAMAITVDGIPKPDWTPDNPGLLMIADLTKILVEGLATTSAGRRLSPAE